MAPSAERYLVEVDDPLTGDVDLDAILATVPDATTLKGMFCARYVAAIDEPWDEIVEDLTAPPKGGKYTSFEDYPMADYLRLMDRAARNRFPRSSTREAYRLLGRGDIEVFAESTLGKVTFSLLRDPAAALARYPEILGVLTRGAVTGTATRAERHVALAFPSFVGSIEGAIGCFEALVMSFDASPRLEVTRDARGGARFDVRWTG